MIVVKYKPGVETNDVLDSYFGEEFYTIVHEELSKQFKESDIIVTSGTDGKHSENSMHYQSKAQDLRIRHLETLALGYIIGSEPWANALGFAFAQIAEQLPNYCFIVHAKDDRRHVHCQYGRKNIIGKGVGEHKNLYLK